MPDVVEQGTQDEERPGRRGSGAGRVALLVLAALVVLAVSRSGLLSADPPAPGDRPGGVEVPEVDASTRLIARYEDHLVRLGQDDWDDGALLPGPGLSSVVPVRSFSTRHHLVGVVDGLLFRVGTGTEAEWAPIGRAVAVLAATPASNRAVIWRGRQVVEVDVATGRVVDDDPFRGFDSADAWTPVALVAVTGTRALLMTRPAPEGTRVELALAWPTTRVQAQFNPAVQSLGIFDSLLGTTDEWVITRDSPCAGAVCRIQVVSLTRDDVLVREVVPPAGWTFLDSPPEGRTHEALVAVARVDDESAVALARIVPGGDNALLIRGTQGVDLRAGLADSITGAVYLVVRAGDERRVRVWQPEQPGRAQRLEGPDALPAIAKLVCVCG